MPSNFSLFKKQLDDAVGIIESTKLLESKHVELMQKKGALVDTQSLLARCEQTVKKYKKTKPTIRIIHHLACSGGALLSEYLRTMPNVYLLDETHPYVSINKEFPSLEVSNAVKNERLPFNKVLNGQFFLENIKKVHQHASRFGLVLIIRDNAYFDYLFEEKIRSKSIISLLKDDFNIISVVLYRNTIDTFASLANIEFFHNKKLSFNEYCERSLAFICDYPSAKLLGYEGLSSASEKTIKTICEHLHIDFNESYDLLSLNSNQCKFDDWAANEIDCYRTKLKTAPSLEDISNSESYFVLQNLLKTKNSKLIIIASMPRSGSTWLFNCVREIYKSQNLDFYSCWVEDYEPSNGASTHIVKIHQPEHHLSSKADVIISARRDVRDVIGSLIRMGWLKADKAISHVNYLINEVHPFWFDKSNLEINYSDVINNPNSVISSISSCLNIKLNENKLSMVNDFLLHLSSPDTYDLETQMHPKHRAIDINDYSEFFSPEVNNKLNEHAREWLTKFGYK